MAQDDPAVKGQWGPVISLPSVPIHASVLPDGRVLFWGRREWKQNGDAPADGDNGKLDTQECTPRIWDPAKPNDPPTEAGSPLLRGGPETVNLFCSGHTFMADGRLFVAGGHISDAHGSHKIRIYDWRNGQWEKGKPMGPPGDGGRWYPTVVALPDEHLLVLSGDDQNENRNPVLQVWKDGEWDILENASFIGLPYYPWMHVAPDGRVFMAGSSRPRKTQLLDVRGEGTWDDSIGEFKGKDREYGSSVMYAPGKVLITGGGIPPQKSAEIIDLTKANPKWEFTDEMDFERRHQNATLLPDGTVLITGGTSGSGEPDGGFNDVTKPVYIPELWDPARGVKGEFRRMAEETQPRLYHSVAVLLRDGRVLSAGGGEYRPGGVENPPEQSMRDLQIYSPPYLFHGPRPSLTLPKTEIGYGETFEAETADPDSIGRVSWVRLSSVTHAFNQGQRINFLPFRVENGTLKVTAPNNRAECTPGHYILFIFTKGDKPVPSIGEVIRIR